MIDNKTFISVKEMMTALSVSESKAYSIARQLNKELAEQGYLVIPGRVSRKYFEERFYGIDTCEVRMMSKYVIVPDKNEKYQKDYKFPCINIIPAVVWSIPIHQKLFPDAPFWAVALFTIAFIFVYLYVSLTPIISILLKWTSV